MGEKKRKRNEREEGRKKGWRKKERERCIKKECWRGREKVRIESFKKVQNNGRQKERDGISSAMEKKN